MRRNCRFRIIAAGNIATGKIKNRSYSAEMNSWHLENHLQLSIFDHVLFACEVASLIKLEDSSDYLQC